MPKEPTPTSHISSEEAEIIRLSVEEQCLLAEALLNPPAPAAALVRAAERYRRLVRNGAASGGSASVSGKV